MVSAAFGLAFGTLEVTMPAFADERGSAATGGVLLAALAAGQHARRRLVRVARVRRAPVHQMIWFCAVFAVALVPLAFAGSIPVMLVLMAWPGSSSRRGRRPARRSSGAWPRPGAVTEAYTWEMTAVIAGFALGGVLSGVLVESAGVREALIAAAAAAARRR